MNKKIIKILLLIFIFSLFNITDIKAYDFSNVLIHNQLNKNISLTLYKLDEYVNIEELKKADINGKNEIIDDLLMKFKEKYDIVKRDVLDNYNQKIYVNIYSNSQNNIKLDYGIYYYREIGDNATVSGIILSYWENHRLYLKENYSDNDRLIKIVKYRDNISDENRLSDIKFRLYMKKIDTDILKPISHNKYEYSLENGNYDLITDDKGEIVLNNLPVGNYILKEINTIDGYVISDDIEIDLVNEKMKVLNIVNYKQKDTGNGLLSKTGVTSLGIALVGIIMMCIVLIIILRRNEEKQ